MAFYRKMVEKKEQIARRGAWGGGATESVSQDRLPPGQRLVRPGQFPVLDLGVRPRFDPATWSLEVFGEVDRPLAWSWDELRELPAVTISRDFHCVTTWSKYDVTWRGVLVKTIAELTGVRPAAQHVIAHCADLGYTTNVPLEDMLRDDVLVAWELEGGPIPADHGGPVRTIVPHLYGWKSAKFVRGIEFAAADQPGFWEVRGYHNYGDPWREQRFG